MLETPIPTVLILAGQRLGRVDPLAAKYGQEHKCLIPMLGRPIMAYVLDAVDAAFPTAPLITSINDPAALDGHPEVQRFRDAGRLTVVKSRTNLLDSVLAAAEGVDYPLLMTTGDNVLVTPRRL